MAMFAITEGEIIEDEWLPAVGFHGKSVLASGVNVFNENALSHEKQPFSQR